nr:ribonuclease H-like domain-containing protein [Tanacetum cinerariifolium]
MKQIPLDLTCPKLNVTIAIEEAIFPGNADHQRITTKKLLEDLSKQRYLFQMLWCLSVMQLVAMIRVLRLKKNLLILHLWLMPHQAHQVLQDPIMRYVFDCEELPSHKLDNTVPKSQENDRYKTGEGYHAVPPAYTRTFMASKPDLVFNDAPDASESVANVVNFESSINNPRKDMSKTLRPDAPIIIDWIYNSKDETENEILTRSRLVSFNAARPVPAVVPQSTVKSPRPVKHVVYKAHSPIRRPINHIPATKHSNFNKKVTNVKVNKVNAVKGIKGNAEKASANWIQVSYGLGPQKILSFLFYVHGNPQQALKDKCVIDSGCSRHMTRNISFLLDFEEINEDMLHLEGILKVELKFNLFSVSQRCDKKNRVLFTDTKCVVLSSDYKLPHKNHVLLRGPRENNMYNVDLKNVVPSGYLTCLFAKATLDESNLWHRRLGHINFKTMNKLVKGNLVKGIKREFSVARTLQQNGVTERKNRILIEAARTMLADLLLPIPFWAEAVNIVCYVQNKPRSLGKFNGKADEGFLVGYFVNNKAFRVFNSRTRIVNETMHINFLENKPNVAGIEPWCSTFAPQIYIKKKDRRNQDKNSRSTGSSRVVCPDEACQFESRSV